MEFDLTFRSLLEWKAWAEVNRFVFDAQYANNVGEEILVDGFTEPLTKIIVSGHELQKSAGNWREELGHRCLNSRMRAVILVLAEKIAAHHPFQVKIYAPEAVTGLALLLRGLYPKFLGSEYVPDVARRDELYPIPHQDLMNLDLPSGQFDLVTTNEVLEHVPDIDRALAELARVLKRGAWHVGTHPFLFMSEMGKVRSKLVNGEVVHIEKAEWHGNPADPSGGSLVFEIPGWDIIDRAKRAGFTEAHMRFIASKRYGILTQNTGVFVLCCQR